MAWSMRSFVSFVGQVARTDQRSITSAENQVEKVPRQSSREKEVDQCYLFQVGYSIYVLA